MTRNHSAEEWTTIITPEGKWYDLKLKEIWQYRGLIFLFVKRDFVASYKQTILGYFWFIIPPIISTFFSTLFYKNIISLPTDGLPPYLFYMSGGLMYGIFAGSYSTSSNIFAAHAGIFGKVYFPRLTVPIASLFSNLINTGTQFGIFVTFLIIFYLSGAAVKPNLWMLSIPLLVLLSMGLGFGPGLIASVVTARYRDFGRAFGFALGLVGYVSPTIFPLSQVPDQYRILFLLNPVTPLIEMFRYGFLGQGSVEPLQLAYSAMIMVVILAVGLTMFNRAERTFLDTV